MNATIIDFRPTAAPANPATRDADQQRLLSELVTDHGPTLHRCAMRWTSGDTQRAEDLVQETWIRAWRNLDKMTQSHGSVRGWLIRVAHNIAIDQHRSRASRAPEVAIDDTFDPPAMAAAPLSDQVLGSMMLSQTLAAVPAQVRAVLVEVYVHDRTAAQAAAVLGIPVGTVKSRLHYGLANLREQVRDLELAG